MKSPKISWLATTTKSDPTFMKKHIHKPNLMVADNHEIPRHILQMSCGITVQFIIDEASGQSVCVWSKRPTLRMIDAILREYVTWRNEILDGWAKRHRQIPRSTPKVLMKFQPKR